MNRTKIKRVFILLIVILVAILIIKIVNIALVKNETQDNMIEENDDRYSFDFGEPIDLDSQYGMENYIITGTSEGTNFGYISETYDDFSIWQVDGNIVADTAHGYVTFSTSWLSDGLAQYMDEPQFGYLKRVVMHDRMATANYIDVTYDDAVRYGKIIKDKGYTNDAEEEKDKSTDYYRYIGRNEGDRYYSVTYDNGSMVLKISE